MEHFKALVGALCLQLVICTSLSRGDFRRQQSLEVSAEFQPDRLEGASATDVSLLSVVQRLQHPRSTALVAKEVRSERLDDAQSDHERQMLVDMSHLEDQLESWKQAEYNIQRQMYSQKATMEFLKAQQEKAARDQNEAAGVWRCVKIFMCMLAIFGFAVCIHIARMQRAWTWQSKMMFSAPEPMLNIQTLEPHRDVPEQTFLQTPSACTHSMKETVDDDLRVTMCVQHPTAAESPDPEAALSQPHQTEEVGAGSLSLPCHDDHPKEAVRRASITEFFSLAEETPGAASRSYTTASAEEDWWNDA
jgi:hypothetical protein